MFARQISGRWAEDDAPPSKAVLGWRCSVAGSHMIECFSIVSRPCTIRSLVGLGRLGHKRALEKTATCEGYLRMQPMSFDRFYSSTPPQDCNCR
jgi:hypothetical protein